MATKKTPPAPARKPIPQQPTKLAKRQLEFLAELSAYADAQRQLIAAECAGFSTNASASAQRAERARQDYRFFVNTYFPHYVRSDHESAFHAWFYDNVPGLVTHPEGRLVNLSAPRGEGKSTLGTQLLALWCVCTGSKHFMPIVMDSWDQASPMLEAIKTELTDNPRLAMDFPEATGKGRVWNVSVVLTANNIKLQAFGSGKKMRGLRHGPHRPDLVFLDDIENDENVRSKEQRDKTEQWVAKTVLNLGPPDGSMSVLYLNTILHHDSVANRYHRKARWVRRKFKAIIRWPDRMDLWQQWEELYLNDTSGEEDAPDGLPATASAADAFYRQHATEMQQGAVVSWPSMRPLIKLMQLRAENHRAFDCEQQNDPSNDEAALFPVITYWVQPQREWIFFGAHDPSLGRKNKGRDPSACLVGGFDRKTGILDVVEARIARIVPDKQIDQIIDFQKEYRCLAWAFESVQFQEFMRQELVKRSAARGIPVPAVPGNPSDDKELRIEGLSPHVANGLIRSHPRHIVLNDQLRHYPEADHDDGPDALEMLWKLCHKRGGLVPRIVTKKRVPLT